MRRTPSSRLFARGCWPAPRRARGLARVLAARLLARAGRTEEALLELSPLREGGPPHALLTARLELERGQLAPALVALAGWREWVELEQAREAAALTATLHRARGDGEAAAAAWSALGGACPRRLRASARGGRDPVSWGLGLRAVERLEAALELAGDPERRVRARVALARAREHTLDEAAARADWAAVESMLARDHWRMPEVRRERLRLARLAGSLEEHLAELSARVDEQPDDAGALEHLAWVLIEDRRNEAGGAARRQRGALADRQRSRRAAPDRRGAGERPRACARELQRLAAVRPNEPELERRVGDALLRLDRIPGALGAYGRFLEARPDDVGARVELAQKLAACGREDVALRWLGEARATDSADLDLVRRMAALLQGEAREALLDETAQSVAAAPERALLWLAFLDELDAPARADAWARELERRYPERYAVHRAAAERQGSGAAAAASWGARGAGAGRQLRVQRAGLGAARAAYPTPRAAGSADAGAAEAGQLGDAEPARWLRVSDLAKRLRDRPAELAALRRYGALRPDQAGAREQLVERLLRAELREEAAEVLTALAEEGGRVRSSPDGASRSCCWTSGRRRRRGPACARSCPRRAMIRIV